MPDRPVRQRLARSPGARRPYSSFFQATPACNTSARFLPGRRHPDAADGHLRRSRNLTVLKERSLVKNASRRLRDGRSIPSRRHTASQTSAARKRPCRQADHPQAASQRTRHDPGHVFQRDGFGIAADENLAQGRRVSGGQDDDIGQVVHVNQMVYSPRLRPSMTIQGRAAIRKNFSRRVSPGLQTPRAG